MRGNPRTVNVTPFNIESEAEGDTTFCLIFTSDKTKVKLHLSDYQISWIAEEMHDRRKEIRSHYLGGVERMDSAMEDKKP